MATLTKQLQKIVRQYLEEGQSWPTTTQDIARWAIRKGLWAPKQAAIIDQCANQLARAMREEHITDPQGRIVRAKHVAKINRNGAQLAFWDDIRTATRQHMEIAFQQRRQQVVGDCKQLKTDVDSYNENRNPGRPIQLNLDFTHDVEEAEIQPQTASNF